MFVFEDFSIRGRPKDADRSMISINFYPIQSRWSPNYFNNITRLWSSDVHLESFNHNEICKRASSILRIGVSRKVNISTHPRDKVSPRRIDVVESNVISTKPNDIENVDNCCRNDIFGLGAPTSTSSFHDINGRVQIDTHVQNLSKPVPILRTKGQAEKIW